MEELPLRSKLSFYKLACSLPPFCCVLAYKVGVYGYTRRVRAWEMVGSVPPRSAPALYCSSLKLDELGRGGCDADVRFDFLGTQVIQIVVCCCSACLHWQSAYLNKQRRGHDSGRLLKTWLGAGGRDLFSCRLWCGSMAMQHLLGSWASRFVTTLQALVSWEAPVLSPWLC